jgi:UDP:flavonoid glycosyltransferase YjiC (YdhE family)
VHITILTTGSHGDVQPYVALGVGLKRAGHRVRLATHENFRELIERHGLGFHALKGDARDLHGNSSGQCMIRDGDWPLHFIREFARIREPLIDDWMEQSCGACRDTDLVLASLSAIFLGQAAAEKVGVPLCLALLQPATPTRYFGSCLLRDVPGWLPGSGWLHSLSHAAMGGAFWWYQGKSINRARARVGLPAHSMFGVPLSLLVETPTLYGYSPHVVPPPPDWGARISVLGYWFLNQADDWAPSAELEDFLAAGEPPVVVGFGSMSAGDAERLTGLAVAALERSGQRGILLTGWGGLKSVASSERLLVLASAPHDWLFPRARATVHHGGAGTTAASFRAGKPAVIVPFMADQRFWGRRAQALGVSPAPIPRKRLTETGLATAIEQAVGDVGMRERAAKLGVAIRDEDGVAQSVAAIERLEREFKRTAPRRPRWKQLLAACAPRRLSVASRQ